jgi:hypothetical protein
MTLRTTLQQARNLVRKRLPATAPRRQGQRSRAWKAFLDVLLRSMSVGQCEPVS